MTCKPLRNSDRGCAPSRGGGGGHPRVHLLEAVSKQAREREREGEREGEGEGERERERGATWPGGVRHPSCSGEEQRERERESFGIGGMTLCHNRSRHYSPNQSRCHPRLELSAPRDTAKTLTWQENHEQWWEECCCQRLASACGPGLPASSQMLMNEADLRAFRRARLDTRCGKTSFVEPPFHKETQHAVT